MAHLRRLTHSFFAFRPHSQSLEEERPAHHPYSLAHCAGQYRADTGWGAGQTFHCHKPLSSHQYEPSLAADPFLGKSFNNITYTYLVNFCNRFEYVTAPTATALNLLYEHGLRAPAGVISNGIDLKKFTPGERSEQVLQRLNLPLDRPLVLHINRLNYEKRVDVLLDAAAKMTSNGHIALVCTGPAEADLRAQAERLNITDRVSFLGFVRDSDLVALRRSSELFVIPPE